MRVVVAAALLVLVSCAEPVPNAPAPQDVATAPSTLTSVGGVASAPSTSTSVGPAVPVSYGCGSVDLGDNPDAWADMNVFEGDFALIFEGDEEFALSHGWWEEREWRIASETDAKLILLGYSSASGRYASASFDWKGMEWWATGWGDCRVEAVAQGFGIASFELDPANPPDALSSEITVLATERECANGEAPDGRHVKASTIETDDAVQILILIEPIFGGATCPGNPSFPVTVSLAGPLGDRLILDDSTGPPTEKPWPIPTRAGELQVWLAGDAPTAGTANVFAWTAPSPGALIVSPSNWSEESTWFQSFTVDEVTITGFVTSCDGCEEECEASACDELDRLGPECSTDYMATDGFDSVVTIRHSGTGCTVEVSATPIEP